jgi:hypothetical protein
MSGTYGLRSAAAFLLLAGSIACGGSSHPAVVAGLASHISQVSVGGLDAALRTGHPATGSGPVVTLDAGADAVTIPGGSRLVTVTSPTAFTTVAVAVQGVDGYYELTGLPSGTAVTLVVTFSQHAPASFTLAISAGAGTGYGTVSTLPVAMTSVGTGDVQVNVSWDVDSDVDLHVVDPSGYEIFYGQSSSTSGGSLDLDSNAGCSLDHKRSENITWPAGGAPRGTYTVRVDYWSSCSVTATNYVVTANVTGQATRIDSGQFTGSGDTGGLGAGTLIWTFTY